MAVAVLRRSHREVRRYSFASERRPLAHRCTPRLYRFHALFAKRAEAVGQQQSMRDAQHATGCPSQSVERCRRRSATRLRTRSLVLHAPTHTRVQAAATFVLCTRGKRGKRGKPGRATPASTADRHSHERTALGRADRTRRQPGCVKLPEARQSVCMRQRCGLESGAWEMGWRADQLTAEQSVSCWSLFKRHAHQSSNMKVGWPCLLCGWPGGVDVVSCAHTWPQQPQQPQPQLDCTLAGSCCQCDSAAADAAARTTKG